MEIDNTNNAEGDESDDTEKEPIPERTTFTCLTHVDSLQLVFGILGTSMSFIVILEEY